MADVLGFLDVYKHWIGGAAAVLTTVCFVPQVWQVFTTRDTKAISLGMYVIFTLGIIGWFIYGVMIESWPMIICDGITAIMAVVILSMKKRHG